MPDQDDIAISYGRSEQLCWIGVGLVAWGIGLWLLALCITKSLPLEDVWKVLLLALLFLGGAGLLLVPGVVRFRDRTAKLSLTAEGLRDHRTGALVRWP